MISLQTSDRYCVCSVCEKNRKIEKIGLVHKDFFFKAAALNIFTKGANNSEHHCQIKLN